MALLITEFTQDVQVVTEAREGKQPKLFIEGIFMQAEKKNRNGRIYTRAILQREAVRYNEEYVKTKRALGELNHPSRPTIDPERASHVITELDTSGPDFHAKARVLTTPMGNVVRGLIEEGDVQIGVSTRGLGSVKRNSSGITEVQSDFRLCCVDIVSDPSGINCFVDGIMEGKDWAIGVMDSDQHIEVVQKQILMASSRNLDEVKLKQFQNIFK